MFAAGARTDICGADSAISDAIEQPHLTLISSAPVALEITTNKDIALTL